MEEWDRVQEAVAMIRDRSRLRPDIGIILGTGLSPLADRIGRPTVIPFGEIPHFPLPTVASHVGNLVLGEMGERGVVAMQGRFHLYEGYSQAQVVFPVRVMKSLGISVLVESNAAGGLNPLFRDGDLVMITDHINLMGGNPLLGPNDERFGPRFPDMSRPYSPELIDLAERTAIREGILVRKGVLVGLTGPNLETRAEYRFLRMIGADMVCMSTVPEVTAAVHLGLKVLGFSVVTDMCLPDALQAATLEKILSVAASAEPLLTRLVEKTIMNIR